MSDALSDPGSKRRSSRGPSVLPPVAAAFMFVFFALPVYYLAAMAFAEHSTTEGVVWRLSLDNFRQLLGDEVFQEVASRTLRLSLPTTLFCVLPAIPVSRYLVTSVTVMSCGWLILLGRQGLISWILAGPGFLSGPTALMHNETAIVVGLTHIFLVFAVTAIAGSLQGINPALAPTARSLGAGPVSVFLRVTLPLCLPGIRAGALLVFALSMSAYAIPGVLGGPRRKFISTPVYQQAVSLFNRPSGAAPAVVPLAITPAMLPAVFPGLAFMISFGALEVSLFPSSSTSVTLPVHIYTALEWMPMDPTLTAVASGVILPTLAAPVVSARLARLDRFLRR